jgi:hypothetical protein
LNPRAVVATSLIAILCCVPVSASPESTGSGAVLAAPGGRFAFGQVTNMRTDQYLLDTKTGRLWVMRTVGNGDSEPSLIPIRFLRATSASGVGQFSEVPPP